MRTMLLAAATAAALSTSASAQHGGHQAPAAGARTFLASTAASAGLSRSARVVTVRTMDYAFQMPETIPAGATTFRIENAGKELHHVWIVRLEQGRTPADYFKAIEAAMKKQGALPTWAIDVGGPNASVPGVNAEGTITLEPGKYLMICHIPSPDGVPHSVKGMFKAFTVVPSSAPAAEPRADVTMTLSDYDFTLSAPLTAGRRTIRLVNAAVQPHEAFIARLAPGKTAQDALAFLEKMQGEPPLVPMGGATGLATGRAMSFSADFAPGQYVLLCFVPDAKDGKAHVAHGMVKTIEVK
ncbi:MAG TPA: hypothetical protein VEA99_19150 [Gemmatimonadaceae bacterium]|nr:hypothetical protein [Gemmatimonadaceae bacterium]